jgi:D-glycero-D-manno-heptose 1,7-bisphosphate phosphatase
MVIDKIGLWCQVDYLPSEPCPALFLDRDGVIIVDTHYLGRSEDVRLIDGAANAIARCNEIGIPVIVVTNQSGIGRGYYGWDDFRAVHAALGLQLAAAGAHLDAVLACAYHGDGKEQLRVENHPWRKPNPGMILEASQRMRIELSQSWIVGDKLHDIMAGGAAGLAGGTLIGAEDQKRQVAGLITPCFEAELALSLAECVNALIATRRFA